MKNKKKEKSFSVLALKKIAIHSFVTIIVMGLLFSCSDDDIEENPVTETLSTQLQTITEVAMRYKDFTMAEEDGYAVLSQFNPSPYVPMMGYHYTNGNLLDGTFDIEKPEILLYVPDAQGNLELVGIEYAIPEALSPNPPEGFIGDQDHWALNPNVAGGAWTLHAWVILENPDGVFAEFNPNVPASDPYLVAQAEALAGQLQTVTEIATRYEDFANAEEDGYAVLSEFNPSPYVPMMGYHYTNGNLLDGTFDMEKPEILLYVPNEDGVLELVGVEYAIPEALSPNPPEGFIGDQDHWVLNPNVAGGAWTLHAWVILENPDGVFAEFNPNVPASDPYLDAQAEALAEQLQTVTEIAMRYEDFVNAEEDGYAVPSEFNPSPYVPMMGYHYTNGSLLDGTFELEKPEILLYVPNENGVLELVGVEYAIPEALSPNPPEGFIGDQDHWALNPNVAGGAWTLHAWVILENPEGVFAEFNPNVPASDPSQD